MQTDYRVTNSNVCFDADGVGAFVEGFIPGAVPFHGGAPPLKLRDKASDKMIKENYFNLKTQCFYRSGAAVLRGEYSVSERAQNKMYDKSKTVKERFREERKAIKKDKVDHDGKLKILPKDAMKVILNGDSPDLMDMFMMREFQDLKDNTPQDLTKFFF